MRARLSFLPPARSSLHFIISVFPHCWDMHTYLTLATWKWYSGWKSWMCRHEKNTGMANKWKLSLWAKNVELMEDLHTRMTMETSTKTSAQFFSVSRSRRLIDMMKTIARMNHKRANEQYESQCSTLFSDFGSLFFGKQINWVRSESANIFRNLANRKYKFLEIENSWQIIIMENVACVGWRRSLCALLYV